MSPNFLGYMSEDGDPMDQNDNMSELYLLVSTIYYYNRLFIINKNEEFFVFSFEFF